MSLKRKNFDKGTETTSVFLDPVAPYIYVRDKDVLAIKNWIETQRWISCGLVNQTIFCNCLGIDTLDYDFPVLSIELGNDTTGIRLNLKGSGYM